MIKVFSHWKKNNGQIVDFEARAGRDTKLLFGFWPGLIAESCILLRSFQSFFRFIQFSYEFLAESCERKSTKSCRSTMDSVDIDTDIVLQFHVKLSIYDRYSSRFTSVVSRSRPNDPENDDSRNTQRWLLRLFLSDSIASQPRALTQLFIYWNKLE